MAANMQVDKRRIKSQVSSGVTKKHVALAPQTNEKIVTKRGRSKQTWPMYAKLITKIGAPSLVSAVLVSIPSDKTMQIECILRQLSLMDDHTSEVCAQK
jgi:hypothetical protein